MNPPYSPRRFKLLHPLFISTPFCPTHVRILPETSTSHPKMDNNPQRYKRAQMVRQHRTKQWIKNILIGGVAYYVGYKVAQDEMKKGHKGKKPMTWAREDKK